MQVWWKHSHCQVVLTHFVVLRSTNVDEHFYTCHQSISIFEAKWFPGSINDTHIVVLTSDNQMR